MIQIRAIDDADCMAIYELTKRNASRLADYFPITLEKTQTPEKTSDAIRMYKLLSEQNELHVFSILAEGERTIGLVFLKNIDKKALKCELAYFIDVAEEGKGYTTDAVKQTIDFAFGRLDLNKIYCRVATNNTASNKVVLKNNFALEGVLKQEYRINDGTFTDLNYYGLLKN